MPRDASGTYTLPAGNPVVVGTTIDASWANTTMDDVATVLTDSLSRTGDGGMLVAMEFASGLVGAPGITWTSEPTSGFYLADTNDMRVSIAGSDRARFRADATDPLQIWIGAAWANVLNAANDAAITGDWTFSNAVGVTIANAAPVLNIEETDAAANNGKWLVFCSGTQFNMAMSNDANDAIVSFMVATRTANNSDVVLFTTDSFRVATPSFIINPAEDVASQFTIGSTAAIDRTQQMTMISDTYSISMLMIGDGTAYGWYDETLAAWGLRLVPSSEEIQAFGYTVIHTASTTALDGVITMDAPVTAAGFGTGGKVKDGGDTARAIGFNVMPVYEIDVADTLDLAHNGMYWHNDGAATFAYTCDEDSDIPQGATFVISNEGSAGVMTIIEGIGVTLKWFDGSGTVGTGTRTLAVAGVATIYKYSDTVYHVWGNGLS